MYYVKSSTRPQRESPVKITLNTQYQRSAWWAQWQLLHDLEAYVYKLVQYLLISTLYTPSYCMYLMQLLPSPLIVSRPSDLYARWHLLCLQVIYAMCVDTVSWDISITPGHIINHWVSELYVQARHSLCVCFLLVQSQSVEIAVFKQSLILVHLLQSVITEKKWE